MQRLISLMPAGLLVSAVVCGTEPWTDKDPIQPEQVAKDLRTPLPIHVGFPVLYRASHITDSEFAGNHALLLMLPLRQGLSDRQAR